MKRCPDCARFMVQKPLFTSLYWECQYCEEKPKTQVPDDTTKEI